MTPERYRSLNEEEDVLTPEELKEGWHYCWDWDGLLIGPEMDGEWEVCTCRTQET